MNINYFYDNLKLKRGDILSEYGTITFTKDEKEVIRKEAKKVNRSMSNYLFTLVLENIEKNKKKEGDESSQLNNT